MSEQRSRREIFDRIRHRVNAASPGAQHAGLEHLHPHQFRHTFAAAWLADGGTEGDLMRLAGWKSLDRLNRYGAAVACQRAHAAHRRLAPGDNGDTHDCSEAVTAPRPVPERGAAVTRRVPATAALEIVEPPEQTADRVRGLTRSRK